MAQIDRPALTKDQVREMKAVGNAPMDRAALHRGHQAFGTVLFSNGLR